MPKDDLIYELNTLRSFLEECSDWSAVRQMYAIDICLELVHKFYGKEDKYILKG